MAVVSKQIASHGNGAFTVNLFWDDVTGRVTRIEWACTRGVGTLELHTDTRTLGTLTVAAGESDGRNVPNRYNHPLVKQQDVADEARLRTTWRP